ncbi:hypothetical protein KJ836_03765 [Patescibacteria group bacterium]|nr:hypothetical protein [Patescibacteria group bacterium]
MKNKNLSSNGWISNKKQRLVDEPFKIIGTIWYNEDITNHGGKIYEW